MDDGAPGAVAGLPPDLVDRFLSRGFSLADLHGALAKLGAAGVVPDGAPARNSLDIHFLPVCPIALYRENQSYASRDSA